tara:strand:- start:189 stop:1211 length:1023 start_codon:yes stop_codon:yes gene_type:complete
MKKYLIVTGGLGFIGSNLIKLLLKKKYSVINIDNVSYSSNFYNLKDINKNKNYRFIKCDINNEEKLIHVFNKYKPICIFNLAAETHVDRSIDSAKPFIKSNIQGIFNLLEAFKKYFLKTKNTKLIHVSTDEVYGDILRGRTSETHPYKPSSPYAASKASSDHMVFSYIRTFGLPAIITNCSNNYGPGQHPEKLIPKLIYNIINNIHLPIYGDGKNSREWIFVQDHCEALFKVFKIGQLGEFYNIGSNKNYDNLNITKKLLNVASKHIKVSNRVKIKHVKDRPGHDKRYALNSNKIKTKLSWSSTTKINEGLEKTFLWYLNNDKYFNSIKKNQIIKRLGKI